MSRYSKLISLAPVLFLFYFLNQTGCVSFGPAEDKRHQTEKILACPADAPDSLEMIIKVTDYSVEATIESADIQFYDRYQINDQTYQQYIVPKVASICYNPDETYTAVVGLDPDSYEVFMEEVVKERDVALTIKDKISRLKALVQVREKYYAYLSVQRILKKYKVDLAVINFSRAFQEMKQIQSSLVIGVEYIYDKDNAKLGSVARAVFQNAFVKNGFKVTPKELLKKEPDLSFKVKLKWVPIEGQQAGGQIFSRVFATVELFDDQGRTLGATIFKSKGGGFDQNAARVNAIRSIEKSVSKGFLKKVIAH